MAAQSEKSFPSDCLRSPWSGKAARSRNGARPPLRARSRRVPGGSPPRAANGRTSNEPSVGGKAAAGIAVALEQALGQLPAEQRRCLELFYLEEKSYQEIVATTGLALNLVKSHLQNGRRMLKRSLHKELRMKDE